MSSIIQESWLTLAYWESWYIQNLRNIQNPVKHLWCNVFFLWTMAYIRWSILFRVLCKYKMYRLLMHSKLKHIQNSSHSRYFESLWYSLHRTLCNLDILKTYVYSSPSTLRTRGIWWAVFYRILYDTGIFRTRGIFEPMYNIYYGEFYSE